MKPAVRVKDVRSTPKGSYALAWFTTVVGFEEDSGTFHGLLSVRDCELRESKEGEKYIRFPAKPRIRNNKDGTATYQNDDADKPIYDPVVDSVMEQYTDTSGNTKWGPTKAARQFKERVAGLAVEAWSGLAAETEGRGGAPAKTKAAAAAIARPQVKARGPVAATTGSKEVGSPLAESDDLPF